MPDRPVGTGGIIPNGVGGAGGSGPRVDGAGGRNLEPPPAANVSPTTLDFGTVEVGSTSTGQAVAITVIAAPVAFSPTVTGAGFAISGTTCANPQPVGGCKIMVVFAPVTMGAAVGTLSVGVASVALKGIGISGTVMIPDRVDLGTVQINQSVPVVIPINTSTVAALTCAAAGEDLSLTSQTCPSSMPVSAPCTFTFVFKAAVAGNKNESVVCSTGGRTTRTSVTARVVTGAGAVLSPPTADLTAAIGGLSTATFVLSNSGGAPTGNLTVAITAGAGGFTIQSNECTGQLAPAASCKIQVAFKPITLGLQTGTLTVTDQTSGKSAVATLIATAIESIPKSVIEPSLQDFGTVTVGKTKTASFTITNTSRSTTSMALNLTSGSAEFTIDPQTCKGMSIPPGGQCTFAVTFAPTSAGPRTANIIVSESEVAIATARAIGTGGVPDAGPPDAATGRPCFHCGQFPATPVGQTSAGVVCTSEGPPPDGGIVAMRPQVTGDFAIVDQACTTTRCTVTLVFKPTQPGQRVGTIMATNMDILTACGADFVATGL